MIATLVTRPEAYTAMKSLTALHESQLLLPTLRLQRLAPALRFLTMPHSPLLPAALWQGITCEWLWVYHGIAPRVEVWSQEITVPAGLFFVESGGVKIRVGNVETEVPQGHAFFSAPGLRQQWFQTKTRLLSVGLRSLWPEGLPLYLRGLNCALPAKEIKSLHTATRSLFRAIHGAQKQVSYAEATAASDRDLKDWAMHEAAFRTWFAHYVETLDQQGIKPMSRPGAGDRRLQHLHRWLQAAPLNRPLDLEEAAQRVNLTPRRVHELLNQELGMTAQRYQERRRLELARQRLTHEDTALKEIAFALGFRHPPHFTAWFRRHVGMTPTAFREGLGLEGA